jgi:uncharacterized membrane protein
MLASLSQTIVNLIRLYPAEFITYCAIGSLVLIVLSNPALLLKLVLYGSMIFTGFGIIAHQVDMLAFAMQNTMVSTIQQAFEEISRLIR